MPPPPMFRQSQAPLRDRMLQTCLDDEKIIRMWKRICSEYKMHEQNLARHDDDGGRS